MSSALETTSGDEWILELVKHVKLNEIQLLGPRAVSKNGSSNGALGSGWNALSWVPGMGQNPAPQHTSQQQQRNATPAIRTKPLIINPHHLFYLLMRFEGLALPSGSLDTQLPNPPASRPVSHYILGDHSLFAVEGDRGPARSKDKSDTISLASLRSALAPSSISSSSWWPSSRSSAQQEPSRNLNLLYSCMTCLPSLKIGPTPGSKLIQGFEESCPGRNGIPMDVFKSLRTLVTDQVDPRGLLGWDRLSIQLVSLSLKGSGLEDVGDLIIDAVKDDVKRRKGEKVQNGRRKVVHPVEPPAGNGLSSEQGPDVEEGAEQNAPQPADGLPSLAWYFLRHLSLAQNSLTFVPEPPLHVLSNLSSLDLSSNLLNSVPPALHLLPNLVSLDISDNLIDSVLGISSAIPNITTLILSKNRLESICGLERLQRVARVDLRRNYIYDSGEVGRLAPLERISEVYVAENPIVEELPDWRVDVFVQFEKEGRKVKLDGSEAGFFEKQRIAERLAELGHVTFKDTNELREPKSDDAAGSPAGGRGHSSVEGDSSDMAQAAVRKVAPVRPVQKSRIAQRQRAQASVALDKNTPSSSREREGRSVQRRSSESSSSSSKLITKERNQSRKKRVVELDSPIAERSYDSKSQAVDEGEVNGQANQGQRGSLSAPAHETDPEGSDYAAMSDSEAIKAAVLAGQTSLAASPLITAVDGQPTERGRPIGMPKLASQQSLSKKSGALASVSSSAIASRGESSPAIPPNWNSTVTPETDLTKAVMHNLAHQASTNAQGGNTASPPQARSRALSSLSSRLASPKVLSRTITIDGDAEPLTSDLTSNKPTTRRGSTTAAAISARRVAKATMSMHEASFTKHQATGRSPLESPGGADLTQGAAQFRHGIEALKGEMGDEWLTMLAKGVYKPDGRPTLGRKGGKAAAAAIGGEHE